MAKKDTAKAAEDDDTKSGPKTRASATDEKILQIIPAPVGLRAHYSRKDDNDNTVDSAKLAIVLALVEIDGATPIVRALTLDDITGLDVEAGDFKHAAL